MAINLRSENALARSDELIAIGNKNGALALLVDVICSRWQPQQLSTTLDPIMFRAIELAVQLRKTRPLKDAIQQYKNLIYGTNSNASTAAVQPLGLEEMIKYFITSSTSALTSLLKAAKTTSAATATAITSFSSTINQSNLSNILHIYDDDQAAEDGEKKSTKEVHEIPELFRFIWESYKNLLDMTRHSLRLQNLYGSILNSAISFCFENERKNELRRLSDLLRHHLTIMVKFPAQNGGICLEAGCPAALAANLTTAVCLDSLRLQLSLRFSMLSSTTKLLLWQESFKLLEDIHGLFLLARRTPPTDQLVLYYENLALIFRRSEDYLFLSATLIKLFTLTLKGLNPAGVVGVVGAVGSAVVCSADSESPTTTATSDKLKMLAQEITSSLLAIPLMQAPPSPMRGDRLAQLLGLRDGPPSIYSLIRELNNSTHGSKILELSSSPMLPLLKEDLSCLTKKDLHSMMKSLSTTTTTTTTTTTIQKNLIILYIKGIPLFTPLKLQTISEEIGISSVTLIEEVLIEGSLLGQIGWIVEDEWTIHLTKIPFSPPPTLSIDDCTTTAAATVANASSFSKFTTTTATTAMLALLLKDEQKINLQRLLLIAKQKEIDQQQKILLERKELQSRKERLMAEKEAQLKMAAEGEKKRELERIHLIRQKIREEEEGRRMEMEKKKEILKKRRGELERMIAVIKRHDYHERALREVETPLLRLSYEDQLVMDRKAHQERQTLLREAFLARKAKDCRIRSDSVVLMADLLAYSAQRKDIHLSLNARQQEEHSALLKDAKEQMLKVAVKAAQRRWQWDRDDAKAAAAATAAALKDDSKPVGNVVGNVVGNAANNGPTKYLSPKQRRDAAAAAASVSTSSTTSTSSTSTTPPPPSSTNTRWRR